MAKHKKTVVNLDKPYETNVIGLRGIIYFALGLFLLIVVTFGLMWFLLDVMEQDAVTRKASDNPLKLSKEEALPPEPRLQGAPGFGVDDPNGGRINLELTAPQSEYRELLKQWEKLWAEGRKDPQTGTVVAIPVNEAKQKFLAQTGEAKPAEAGKDTLADSKTLISEASAGRNATIRIR